MKEAILFSVRESIQGIQQLESDAALSFIEHVAKAITTCYQNGGKILIAGNGGSLCDAMHFAEELTGYYRKERKALPAIALSDPGHMSCVGNDAGFEYVFSRSIEALATDKDVVILLTTSGNSQNLVNAAHAAKRIGAQTVAFLGKTGGKLKGMCDFEWIVQGFTYSDRIQELHMNAIHIIIEMVEIKLGLAVSSIHKPAFSKAIS